MDAMPDFPQCSPILSVDLHLSHQFSERVQEEFIVKSSYAEDLTATLQNANISEGNLWSDDMRKMSGNLPCNPNIPMPVHLEVHTDSPEQNLPSQVRYNF